MPCTTVGQLRGVRHMVYVRSMETLDLWMEVMDLRMGIMHLEHMKIEIQSEMAHRIQQVRTYTV